MRISDWSSDVCSSDLGERSRLLGALVEDRVGRRGIVLQRDIARVDRTQLFDQQFAERGLERSEPLSRMVAQHRIDARVGERGIDADEVARLGTSFEPRGFGRSEEHTSELQSLMRISYAVFCFKQNTNSHKSMSH